MTVSGQRACAENVAASRPTQGSGAAKGNRRTPLPKGWGSFCSDAGVGEKPWFYAVAPWSVDNLQAKYGKQANVLDQTVSAASYTALVMAVQRQNALYVALTQGQAQ